MTTEQLNKRLIEFAQHYLDKNVLIEKYENCVMYHQMITEKDYETIEIMVMEFIKQNALIKQFNDLEEYYKNI